MRRIVVVAVAVLVLGGAGALWWTAAAQPVTVDSIGDHVQTLPRGKLPVFAEPGDLPRLYAFALENRRPVPEIRARDPDAAAELTDRRHARSVTAGRRSGRRSSA